MVQVNEGKFRRIRGGLGYATNDCFRLAGLDLANSWAVAGFSTSPPGVEGGRGQPGGLGAGE